MKHLKLYIAVLSVFVCTNILAQKQTKFITGGNAGIYFNFNENNKQLSMSCSPILGYRLTKNVVIGTEIYYSATFVINNETIKNRDNEISVNPFVQLYLIKNLFLRPNFGIGFSKYISSNFYSHNSESRSVWNYTTTTYGLGFGYDIYLTDSFSITPIIGYQHTNYNCTKSSNNANDDNKKRNALDARVGFVYRF